MKEVLGTFFFFFFFFALKHILLYSRGLVKKKYLVIFLGFLFIHKNIKRGTSNEYPQHVFLWRTGENYPRIITKYSFLTCPLVLSKAVSDVYLQDMLIEK